MDRQQRPPGQREWNATLFRMGWLLLVLFGSAALLFSLNVPGRWVIWSVISLASIGWLVRWHTRAFGYRCPHCSHAFVISPWRNMVSPNILGKGGPRKLLRCPNCGRRSWTPIRVLV